MIILYLIAGIALLAFALKKYLYRNGDYWKKRGVPVEPDEYGFFLGIWLLITQQKNGHDFDKERYDLLGDKKYAGSVELGTPTVLLKDLELIKHFLVKDFDHFVDRRKASLEGEPMMGKMLLNLHGQEWKDARSLMSPTFTSGKIRRMFQHFNKSGNGLVEFIKAQPAGSPGSRDVNIKEVVSRYLVDVIGTTAFGLETSILKDQNSEFYKYTKKATAISLGRLLKFIILTLFPVLSRFGLKFVDTDVTDFFLNILKEAMDKRADSKDKKDDFLQLMLEARKGELKEDEGELEEFEKDAKLEGIKKIKMEMDDETVLAQCLLFFLAGLDTTGALLTMSLYHMAIYPEIQEKLRKEVEEVLEGRTEVSYEDINKMKYMDWFIQEILRKYPVSQRLERSCTRNYIIPGTNTVIEKDSIVWLSVIGLHKDPKYYPDPEKFDPERFSPEEKAKRHPYTWLPFGQGPRNCIGMRFALMEAKVAMAYVLLNFVIEPSVKTPIPIKIDPSLPARPDVGVELKFKDKIF